MGTVSRFVVFGATGRVGKAVVRALGRRGIRPVAVSRRALAPDSLGVPHGSAEADLGDTAAVARGLIGADAVFYPCPHHPQEQTVGFELVRSIERARVPRLVVSSAFHPDSRWALVRRLVRLSVGLLTPHYLAKLEVEERARTSRAETVVLMPSNFYENDDPFEALICAGLYPQPIGHKVVSRVSIEDIGEAAARGLTGELAAGAYPLVGPDPDLTGPRCAAIWSKALGRSVQYAGDDREAWRQRASGHLAGVELEDFYKTYAVLQRFGAKASARDLQRSEFAVGRRLIDFSTYAKDRSAAWAAQART